MIVATAGHVDHGKTTLVRALTGVHTDRAPEAQARGMTIDLGFASARFGGRAPIAFIDVPGHERFLRNMLAGVAAIDMALLVVAADDGPMPQTHEHLAILLLLGVPRLAVVLTKTDRVDAARAAQAEAEVLALLAGTLHAGAPVFTVAGGAGPGLDALQHHLARLADQQAAQADVTAGQPAAGRFRLVIDRSFALAGSGRVVTGAVLAGSVQVGDAVRLLPAGAQLRVRSLQVLNQPADAVHAGQRCALNLAGADLKRAEPVRGDWLEADDGDATTSDRLDVRMHWLSGVAPATGPRARLQLHLGAAVRMARLVPLDAAAPAGPWARLLPDRPVSAAWGDRFILRDAAANRTLGGGRVVDACGPLRGRARPQRLAQLAALAQTDPAAALRGLLDAGSTAGDGEPGQPPGAGAPPGAVDLDHFRRARGLRAGELAALLQQQGLHVLRAGGTLLGLTDAAWQGWQARLVQAVDAWHAARPDSLGPDLAALRQQWQVGAVGLPLLQAALRDVLDAGALVRDGLCLRRPSHQPLLAPADADLLARASTVLAPAGLRPPIVGDLATQLGLPLPALQDGLARLAARGLLVRVAPNRWYLPATVAQLEAEARALAASRDDGLIDAAAYRDRTGIGRNLTVQVLDFLDHAGLTRFDGTHHRLRT